MKLKLKMIAAAIAMVSAAGAANAALTPATTGNGSLALYAFNQSTRDFYIRDLGFLMNSFLPSTVTTPAGDGGVTGTRTPADGLTLNPGNTPNFADASFATWFSAQNAADVRWGVAAADQTANAGQQSFRRAIVSTVNPDETILNAGLDFFVGGAQAGGLATLFGEATLSMTDAGASDSFDNAFGFGNDSLATVGQSAHLFYFARTVATGTSGATAHTTQYGNASGFASVTLEADGDFVYSLAAAPSAVPIPAAAWLLGSGLIGMVGMARRRKAAAAAAAAA